MTGRSGCGKTNCSRSAPLLLYGYGSYGAAIPDATVELGPDAGHWPWLDEPSVVERVAAFLGDS